MDVVTLAAAKADAKRYYRRQVAFSDLPATGVYVAHRGNAGTAPENTMEALRAAAAFGAHILEFDVGVLSDGALGIMHDDTVDRTTTGTGNASDYNVSEFRNLVIDANVWHAGGWTRTTVAPLLSEALDEFGGKYVLMIEPKTAGAVGPLCAEIVRRGLQNSVVIETGTLSFCTTAKTYGLKTFLYLYDTTTLAAAEASGKVDWYGIDRRASAADFTAIVATGKPVYGFTVNRRSTVATLATYGITNIVTEQIPYLRGTAPVLTRGGWERGLWPHGLVEYGVKPTLNSSGELVFSDTADQWIMLGSISPLTNKAATYTVECDMQWSTAPADITRYGGILVAAADDTSFEQAAHRVSGYHGGLRYNGQVLLTKDVAGTSLGSSPTTTALTTSTWAHVKFTVTPTTVTFQRTDVAGSSGAVADTAYRGGYVHIGKAADTTGVLKIRNLVVT